MKRKIFWKTAIGLSFLALSMSACGGVTPVSQSSASQQTQQSQTSQDPQGYEAQIKMIYGLYLQSGGTQSYEEWLASIKGKDGLGITGVEKTGSDGLTDTYTIRFSDGTSTQFSIKNGKEAYSCTILPSEHGYMSVDVGSAFVGDDINFVAYPDEGYSLAALYLNGVDVKPQMTNPLIYTTKMVKNGFVVRALFEVNRRVSAEVFKREITDMGILTDEKGFTMDYSVDYKSSSYAYSSGVKIRKSGKYIDYLGNSSSETMLILNDDGTYDPYYRDSGKWKKGPSGLEADAVWAQLVPGFTAFSQFEYTYNSNTGYYEGEVDEFTPELMPGASSGISNFKVLLGFKDDRLNEFVVSYKQEAGSYSQPAEVRINGTVDGYDGKTVIDPDEVQKIIDESNQIELKLIISTAEIDVTTALIDEFRKENPNDSFYCSFYDAEPSSILYGGDVADIFWFSQDQLYRYVDAGVLSPLDSTAKTAVTANNVAASIEGATIDGTLYAYPMTADNGCFLYYDKSVVSENHLNDLAAILNDCYDHGRTFAMEADNAWYNVAFFLGTGCHSIWNGSSDAGFESCDDNYYSPEGVAALRAISSLVNSSAYESASSFDNASSRVGALVSGTWEYNGAVNAFGDNLGCAELPNFTVNGKTYHMGSFAGCKYLGVRKQNDSAKQILCHKLANYLTSYKAQLKRLEVLGYGPSNIEASKSSLVDENPALKALLAQNQHATIQGQYPGSWWSIAARLASTVERYGSNPSDDILKRILAEYNEDINDIAPNTNPTPTFPSGGGQTPTPEPEPEPEPSAPEEALYTITGLPNWIANDGATVFAWSWGGEAEEWTQLTLGTPGDGGLDAKELTATVSLPEYRTGFNLARCVAGTTTPDWTATGDATGRVYNKTGDISISAGETSYISPTWTEYKPA